MALDFFKRNDLVVPRTILADVSLAGLPRNQVREILRQKIEKFLSQPIKIAARGEVAQIVLKDVDISINESQLINSLPFAGDLSNVEIAFWGFVGRRITPKALISQAELLRAIEEKFPKIPQARNAGFILEKGKIKIKTEKIGVAPNINSLVSQLKTNIEFMLSSPLFVDFNESQPTVFASDLMQNEAQILKKFPKKLTLFFEKQKWELNFEKHPDWILFGKKNYQIAGDESPFYLTIDPVAFANFIDASKMQILETAPEDMRIWRNFEGKIQFEGHGVFGRAIDRERLMVLINNALANEKTEAEIPLVVVLPKLEIPDDLQTLGVRELISTGYTRFVGSPPNRIHNIGIGAAKFNGLLIAPGETFSFGDNLGKVDDSTGYKKELVIKPEGTIPEFGGGLCQVSSTMYRAILFAGLPIIERSPHTYAVSYYSQVLGHGLDATIYPPSKDLKFLNDTPGYILIHSYVDGPSVYFKFYGMNDGRKVEMEGPYISNRTNPPEEPVFVTDLNLQPDEKKQVEKPHGGFDALWFRHLTKNGETKEEKIFTRYKAVPAKFLVGENITAEGENKGLAEEPEAP
ncbi:VanW family protein [Candidatus Peregrinibacteria bacterium]|nr:VanW family protein [Candidatus Peregrinibacteria bacterium]